MIRFRSANVSHPAITPPYGGPPEATRYAGGDSLGFSERAKGRSPKEIADYAIPFLSGISEIVTDYDGFVDKTIGDEVMMVLAETGTEGGVPLLLEVEHFLHSLVSFAEKRFQDYPFRIGLAFGYVHLASIEGSEYSEWSVFGETVHLAKRITSLVDHASINSKKILGAIGALHADGLGIRFLEIMEKNDKIYCDCGAEQRLEEISDHPVLKGISSYKCLALLARKPSEGVANHE